MRLFSFQMANARFFPFFLIFSIYWNACSPTTGSNPNDSFSGSWLAMEFWGCYLGSNNTLCPKVNIQGTIKSDIGTTMQRVTFAVKPKDFSTENKVQTDEYGNFSILVPGYSHKVSIIGFNGATLGHFNLTVTSHNTAEVGAVTSGLTVTSSFAESKLGLSIVLTETTWYGYYGSSTGDTKPIIAQAIDGGYYLGGTAGGSLNLNSKQPLISFNGGTSDIGLVKLDKSGLAEWVTHLGGSGIESVASISRTADGGVIVAGSADVGITSLGGKTPLNTHSGGGVFDIIVIKVSSLGSVEWFTYLGEGAGVQSPESIIQTTDEGFFITATTSINMPTLAGKSVSISQSSAAMDWLLLKLSKTGQLEWYHIFGTAGADYAKSATEASNGDIVVTGYMASNTLTSLSGKSPLQAYNTNTASLMNARFSSTGSLIWFSYFGTRDTVSAADETYGTSISTALDGGNYIFGKAESFSNYFGLTPRYSYSGNTMYASMLLKINSSGYPEWYLFFYSPVPPYNDEGRSVFTTPDGGCVVSGISGVIGNLGGFLPLNSRSAFTAESYVVKVNPVGVVQWYTYFGGNTGPNQNYSIIQTADGGYLTTLENDNSITLTNKTRNYSYQGGLSDWTAVKIKSNGR